MAILKNLMRIKGHNEGIYMIFYFRLKTDSIECR